MSAVHVKPPESDVVDWSQVDLSAPTPEHALLADTLRTFVEREVEPQALDADREERFNVELFRRAGELGLLGVTLPEEYGGAGLDATAAALVSEILSTSTRPSVCRCWRIPTSLRRTCP